MATSTLPQTRHKGGSFLIESSAPNEIFTPEDFTEEHLAIARTTDEFFDKEVAPNLEAIHHHEEGVIVSLLRKSGELGLTGVDVPEKFGGMEMDLASMMIVGEHLGKDGSYAVSARRAGRHRHAAFASVRYRRAEAALPAQAGQSPNWSRPIALPRRRPAPMRWPRALAPISALTASITS